MTAHCVIMRKIQFRISFKKIMSSNTIQIPMAKKKELKNLFVAMNKELENIAKWLNANKPSLSLGKTKYSFFK